MKQILLLVIAITLSAFTFANNNAVYTQTVRGTIIDQDSKIPLIGVNVILLGSEPITGTSTDVNGNFRLENVTIGRISLKLSHLGNEEKVIPNLTVESGKETLLFLEMIESLEQLEEIIITGGRKRGEVLNEMALLSARTFTVDETKQYAGSLDDPSRMVSAFAGVSNDPEGLNEIVVRGNTPKGIQWRLEDVEIPNPNHFAFESTTGGPINALSSNMLATSDFYTGAFAPEFGNVTSGIFDMKMRNGNNEKHEFTLGLGALGIDVAAEGPFKKGYSGSYLINYRYSTLALIDNLNLVDYGGVPKYQDLTFKVNLPTKKTGKFSIFALLGRSGIDITEEDKSEKTVGEGSQFGGFGVVGLSHLYQINSKSFIKTTLSASNNGTNINFSSLMDDDTFMEVNKAHWNKNTLTSMVKYSNKINAKHRVILGAEYKHFFYDMKDENYFEKEEKWKTNIGLTENAGLFQSYASWKYRISKNITMVSGLHYTNFLLNNSQAFEPRAAINWDISKKSKLSVGFGKHSMPESIITYYANVYDEQWNKSTPNTDLDLSKANHYVLGFEQRLMKNLNAKVELYYQSLYDVPVENDVTSNYSILNEQHGQVLKELVNEGKGRNYGMEFTLERYFENSYYFLATASLYKSEYKTMKNEWRNTRFDGNYAFNFLAGKEFTMGDPEKGRILSLNTRITYNGSRKHLPLDLEASREAGYGIYDYNNAYTHRLDDILNVNFTASMKFNRQNTTHEIILDFMNLLNGQGKVSEYYDYTTEEKIFGNQMSIFPNVMYRIHF
ncbi:MAG: TonB-dependent receptor [Prolixibacteraceae bacterium]|nr:TonB-dependent receptor [Prolixibacteraceae bacterium]